MLKYDKNINDINFILDNLRNQDFEEIIATWGKNWKTKFIQNTMKTDFMILVKNNTPIAMGGFAKIYKDNPRIACVWLICSKFIKQHKIYLLKTLKYCFDTFSSDFDIMYNFIYKSNFEAKKWLKIFGFKFDNPHPKEFHFTNDFEFFYKINNSSEQNFTISQRRE